jgi:hypothetical protein
MNKKTRLALIGILILLAIVYVFKFSKNWKTVKIGSDEISIQDTAIIDHVFLADKNGHTIDLKKQANNEWKVNNKFNADASKINLLLATIHDMRVQRPIDETQHNTVVADLSSRGIKIECYSKEENIKTFYIGSETADKIGTFYYETSKSEPLIVHIPGFVGYLTPRFVISEIKWKDKLVFDDDLQSIESIEMTYPNNADLSFKIINKQLLDKQNNLLEADSNQLKFYLNSFKGLYHEAYLDFATAKEIDSIKKSIPFCWLILKRKNKQETSLKLYLKKADKRTKEQFDQNNMPVKTDAERFWGIIDDENELVSIQTFNFGKILKTKLDLSK